MRNEPFNYRITLSDECFFYQGAGCLGKVEKLSKKLEF